MGTTDESADAPASVLAAVDAVRRRLRIRHGRARLARRAPAVLVVAAVVALLRPVYWPLTPDAPLWSGAPRALGVALLVAGLLGLAFRYLRLPTAPRPAVLRAIDRAIGRRGVVAGAMLGGQDPLSAVARQDADAALEGFDPAAAFALPRVRPRLGRALLASLALLVASLLGGYDPALARVLARPPTATELQAASELQAAAEALGDEDAIDRESPDTDDPRQDAREASAREHLAERARQIAQQLARADREAALAGLREMREETESSLREARRQRQAARRLARHLAPTSRERSGDESGRTGSGEPGASEQPRAGESASDAEARRARAARPGGSEAERQMRLLARRMREQAAAEGSDDRSERERTLERLSRAADEARRGGERGSAESQRLAEALQRAADAFASGRDEEAARRLDEAAARARDLREAQMRHERAAEALARLMERAGLLERAVQLAMMGREGEGEGMPMPGEGGQPGDGQAGEGSERGLAAALRARLAAMGLAEGPRRGRPGGAGGPGGPMERTGATREGLEPRGDVNAPSHVREGERAVAVLAGLGQNGEARTEYQDVYPSYGAAVEDALAAEDVPAARREAVRRYFESIRPGALPETDDATPDADAPEDAPESPTPEETTP